MTVLAGAVRLPRSAAETVTLTLPLAHTMPPVLGMGAFLKNTVTMIDGDCAFVSRPVGHTDTPTAIEAMESMARRLIALAGSRPVTIAHDLHPDFPSTRFAAVLADELGAGTLAVQHHHAHVAAVAAEHGHRGPLLGLALDGFGLGPGKAAWGGELLLVEGSRAQRLGSLAPLLQPGGDVAAREPWRMAAAALHELGRGAETARRWPDQPAAALLPRMMERGLNCPATSSAGRLFDAAAGLLDVCSVATFEGEAPMALEALVSRPAVLDGGWRLSDGMLDFRPLLAVLADLGKPVKGANLFHGTLAAAMAAWVLDALGRTSHAPRTIALSGGCFYNRTLSADLGGRLEADGLTVLRPTALGPGDPAISLGQAVVAALALSENNPSATGR